MKRNALTLLLALAVSSLAVCAADGASPARPDSSKAAPAAPALKGPVCDAPEAHQFDFWIGTWEVRTPDGKVAGTNRIEAVLGGCALQEHWVGARGMTGTSLNMYIPAKREWHQTWVDDRGNLLLLDGAYKDGSMILSGESKPAPGSSTPTRERITWSRLDGGDVRQLWEQSQDGGATWTVAFDGRYHRAG